MRNEYLRKEHLIYYPELKDTFLFRAGYEAGYKEGFLEGYKEGLGLVLRAWLEKEYSVLEVAQMLNLPLILVENFIEEEKRLCD